MRRFFIGFGVSFLIGGAALTGLLFLWPSFPGSEAIGSVLLATGVFSDTRRQKTPEERYAEALERSANIRGLYMTADVANDPGVGGTRLRENLIRLADETEINGLVIDVKEVCGPDYDVEHLRAIVQNLKARNIWTIARLTVFKDASQVAMHPEWYLKRANPKQAPDECERKRHLVVQNPRYVSGTHTFWRDRRGGYWLDPAHPEARAYIADFARNIIDLGFDELQFDYIRFPSDGDVENAIYPLWDGKTPKYAVMQSFFEFLNRELRSYKPEIILSADLFGYAAVQNGDVGIGQRLEDIGNAFDYISFMVYPSHFYSGFYSPADPERRLPLVNYGFPEVRKYPDVVVYRSLAVARDFLDGRIAVLGGAAASLLLASATTADATTSSAGSMPQKRSNARLRPWLEDFFHEQDQAAGRPYGIEKVRMQIDAAESIANGWLLWNAGNVYTEEALREVH